MNGFVSVVMKRIYALAVAGVVSCCSYGQLSDAGEPTLTDAQRIERAAMKEREDEREKVARAAELQRLTSAPRPEVPKSPKIFGFGGGSLSDFIDAIRHQFGVDLLHIGTVPASMLYSVQVPKMHMGDGQGVLSYRTVLGLYNQVSEDPNVGMGRWIMEGGKVGAPHQS